MTRTEEHAKFMREAFMLQEDTEDDFVEWSNACQTTKDYWTDIAKRFELRLAREERYIVSFRG